MDDTYEREVIRRIAEGRVDALEELYRRHAAALYSYAVRVLRVKDQAEDAVSAVFHSVRTGVPSWPEPPRPAGEVLTGRLRDLLVFRLRGGNRRDFRDVDLWSVVSGREFADPRADAARTAIRKSGVMSAAVLSLVYFSGCTVAETAARLSMTDAECRSRLQVCLERLSGGGGDAQGHHHTIHGTRYSACNAAVALGAMDPSGDPSFSEHLAEGCRHCSDEAARYAAAAHVLPALLPVISPPGDLLERIMFSLKLAALSGAGSDDASATGRPAASGAPEGQVGLPGSSRPAGSPVRRRAPAGSARQAGGTPPRRGRTGRIVAWAAPVAVAAAIFLGSYARTLHARIEEQADVIDALQQRNTELVVKYDRLAGVSGFFESKGVVTVLNGTKDYPGLAGKIVWDTTDRSAMLQILNPPGEFGRGRIRVSATDGEAAVPVAEFPCEGRDTGAALYRFFPMDAGPPFLAAGFSVEVSPEEGGDPGDFRSVLRGSIAGRQ